jgi:hypothetical protein
MFHESCKRRNGGAFLMFLTGLKFSDVLFAH